MWKCPDCSSLFVAKRLQHSCVSTSVEDFLKGKPEAGVELYRTFVREIQDIGDVLEHPVKTRIALMVEVRFAAVNRICRDHITGHLWLKQRVDSDKFYRVERLNSNDYIHHFRLSDQGQIDDEFRSYMKLAYAVGRREHVRKRRVG